MQIGRWDVQILDGGTFRLDGGAMFGTVPRVVWGRLMPPDEEHRISMATNCLLIRGEVEGRRHVVVVDAGNGDKEDDAFRQRFAMGARESLLRSLESFGVTPGEVTEVLLTHLHFDHAGGATRLDEDGQAVPTFPKARHFVQKLELDMARKPHLRVRASYLPWNWEPLVEAGLLEAVEGATEVLPGIHLRPVPGHVPGLQAVEVRDGADRLIYPSDLIPTSNHIQPAWAMGYDLDVVTCVDERVKLLGEVTGTGTILVFEHDPAVPAGRVELDAKGRYRVVPLVS